MTGVAFISQVVATMWKDVHKQQEEALTRKLSTLSAGIEILNDLPAAIFSPSSPSCITHADLIQIT